jgi:hypothetical protein
MPSWHVCAEVLGKYYNRHREFKSLLGVKIAHLVDGSDLFKTGNLVWVEWQGKRLV